MQRRRQLMGMQMRGLPNEYKIVAYLESSGTQYIDMSLNPQYYWEIDADFELLQRTDDNCIFGAQSGNGYALSIYGGMWQVKYGLATQYPTAGTSSVGDHRIKTKIIDIDQEYPKTEFYDNDALFLTKQGNGHFAVPNSLTIFALHNGGQTIFYSVARMKRFEIRNALDKTKIKELIPCLRKSDIKPGMYDTVSKTFYTNAGTGEFIVPA